MTQLGMFDEPDDDPIECRFPMLTGVSGYRAGCRCSRCKEAKKNAGIPSPICEWEGCTTHREKGRRYCAEHPPSQPRRKLLTAPCEICSRSNSWYESILDRKREEIRDLYRRVCADCRQGYMATIGAHALNTDWAIKLIRAEHCELCHKPFPIGQNGRPKCVVDHDHKCCPGGTSCGRCVRGILCYRCNTIISSIETVQDVGLDDVLDYLERTRRPTF